MKKQLVSILTAGCLMAAMVPAAFAADATMSEDAFRSAVAEGGAVTMTGDVTLNSTLEIKDGVTINGNGYTITYTPNTQTYAIDVQTNEPVTFQNVTIDATVGSMTSGISAQNCIPDLTLDKTTLNVMRWGIAFNPTDDGAELNVMNYSVIQNKRVSDYETEAAYGDYRGISLYDATAACVNVTNSTIQGFGYTINLTGTKENDVRDFKGTKIDVSNSKLMGWTALNIWTCNTVFDIADSELRGINTSNGSSDGFAAVVLNDNIYGNLEKPLYNTLTFTGGSIGGYKYGTASEGLIRAGNQLETHIKFVESDDTGKVYFKSNVPNSHFTFTGNLEPELIENYLYLSQKVTGIENIVTQFPAATYNGESQFSYEIIE
ncbi:MAG: hypothetical protein DBY37_14010 [Desulfovibrionaceae bacterium]|nr:MAG: hypothetical protein DBY37_14010 [Desulfovibrionaceae bacterium]